MHIVRNILIFIFADAMQLYFCGLYAIGNCNNCSVAYKNKLW